MSPTLFVVLTLCGLAFGAVLQVSRPDDRIVGGSPTTIGKFPHQLSFRKNYNHICGASIISPKYALIAAHCVVNATLEKFTLHAGTTYKYQNGNTHQIASITSHPQFNGIDYDFAVIEVKTEFPIGKDGIQAVKLCSVEPSAGQTAVVSGWGRLSDGGASPDQLHAVEVPIIRRDICQTKYGKNPISERMICAGVENGGKDACVGDSGGPLLVNGEQCGVVSWGIGCASPQYPGVYSNVANMLDWIKTNAKL